MDLKDLSQVPASIYNTVNGSDGQFFVGLSFLIRKVLL